MSFRKQKSLISSTAILIILCSSFSCNQEDKAKSEAEISIGHQKGKTNTETETFVGDQVSEIFTGVKVEKGYSFSEESVFKIAGEIYSLRKKAVYNSDGDLVKMTRYKPEGVLDYTKDELTKDVKLLEDFNFPLKQNWIYEEGKIIDNLGESIDVEKIDGKFVLSKQMKQVTFYKIK